MSRTCRVGVHGRNDVDFREADYQIIREAKIEAVKMMSQTRVDVFKRLKEIRRDIELITRLYDDRINGNGHSSPEDFATRMIPIMKQLQPYCVKFEIHNEPNHLDRIEGWGQEDKDAHDFKAWYLRTFDILKSQCPWAQLGFPGLAIPHRDLEWIEICRPAVEKSDWLGVHCYWQTPSDQLHNYLADFWGLRFKYYHQKFPNKIIDLTEVGNSNVQNKITFTRESHAREFTEYLSECFKYPYLNSASFFIMSSPDPTWDGFCWRHEDGRIYAITHAVRDMHRPFWTQAQLAPPKPAAAPARPAAQPAPQANLMAQLQEQRDQLQQQLQQAQAQAQQMQAQNAQLQGQIQQLQAQFAQLQAQMQQLQIQNIQLQGQLQQQAQATVLSNSGASGTSVLPPFQPPPLTIPPVVTPVVTPPAAVSAPAIQNITTSLARNPAMPLSSRPMSQIDRIIIHHTATPPTVGAERIAAFLVSNRGRPGINYHYFITAEGTIQQTNELTSVTLQSDPQFNPVAVGIAFAGDFTNAIPTPNQLESGARLIAWLLRQLGLSPQAVYGHKELSKTQSPGVQWDGGARWGSQLRQRIQALLG
jgi:hypothetical protein